jgi:allophanate hydrolase
LVGTRSPYGACRNSFNSKFIAGGSSSGSAVAVATGLASFALGTDTAGSGRVPAAFNNIVGFKPSLGRLSCGGVVPACRSLDCVSIFSLTADDAARVLSAAEGFDAQDVYSRPLEDVRVEASRIGIPRRDQLMFFGDDGYSRLFDQAVAKLRSLGYCVVDVDFAPFLEAAQLLYGGPWAAERFAAVEQFIKCHARAMHPVTRGIIEPAQAFSAVDAFKAQYKLMALKRTCESVWSDVDFIMSPTAGTIFEISQIAADPVALNSKLGYYTNFVNLLDLAAVAIPAGFRSDGLPFGVTLVGRRATDRALLEAAARLHRTLVLRLGALQLLQPLPPPPAASLAMPADYMALAVCGAHMQGMALNHQLRDRGGYLLRKTRTSACYRLYALPGGPPQRPGLKRVSGGGAPIALEVWALRKADFASFLSGIPAPLSIGTVELEGGESVPGFLCESYAVEGARDITALGGWSAYLNR